MLFAAVIAPNSKLATARGLRTDTATSSLGPCHDGRRKPTRATWAIS
jgi:hypothetical protein